MTQPIPAMDLPAAPRPDLIGQATAVEQSRAVAEVQAMVVVAQQRPRNLQASVGEMRQSCDLDAMAERAFYRYSRGGSAVSGPTVQLMRELARCFGNVTYGISELRRDDAAGISEMQAWAWDLQANTRAAQTFVVPHKRDKRGGPEALVDLRDIYEATANQGARRLREAIRAVLPPWFVEEAIERCNATLKHGGGKPLPRRIADAMKVFEGIGVTPDQLVMKLGRPAEKWTEHDVAQLSVIFKSIQRGEISADEEFPAPRVTVDELTGGTSPSADAASSAPAAPAVWPEARQPGSGVA